MRLSVNEEPNPLENYLADVEYAEARYLEDYVLIEHDFDDAIYFAERALEGLKALDIERGAAGKFKFERDQVRTFEADWIAAVIKYCRCFSPNVRTSLAPSIFDTVAHARSNHDYFVDLRNKHIAHATNGFEQAKAFVALPPIGTVNASVLYVSAFCTRQQIDDVAKIEVFIALANQARAEAHRLGNIAGARVFERAAQQPIEELYARPYAAITSKGGTKDAKLSRPDRPRGWREK